MDAAKLKELINDARRIEIEAAGVRFQCMVPTPLAMRTTVRGNLAGGAINGDVVLRQITLDAVTGWKGASAGLFSDQLTAAEAAEGVEFDAELLDALFNARPDILDEVGGKLFAAFDERKKAKGETLKN